MDSRVTSELEQIYYRLKRMKQLAVVPFSHPHAALGEDVLAFHVSKATLFVPLEDLSEVVEVCGHEGVELMVVIEEEHAVADEVVHKLAQYYLLGYFAFH